MGRRKRSKPNRMNAQMVPQGDEQQVDAVENSMVDSGKAQMTPAEELQLDNYTDNATLAVYSQASQKTALSLLQAKKDPVEALAFTAYHFHQQLEKGLRQKGEYMTNQTLFFGAAHLVAELAVLAEAAKIFTLSPDERMAGFKAAMQMYFREGLRIFKQQGPNAPGAIDPVKLQEDIEPLMNGKQKEMGMQMASANGLSKTVPAAGMPMPREEQIEPQQPTPEEQMQQSARVIPPQQAQPQQTQQPKGLMGGM